MTTEKKARTYLAIKLRIGGWKPEAFSRDELYNDCETLIELFEGKVAELEQTREVLKLEKTAHDRGVENEEKLEREISDYLDKLQCAHEQDAAQIGLLKAELDECKANESYATGMLQRREITNLKTQLKIELDSHESTLNMLQLLNAELASLRERVLVYETALKFYADADNFELGSACEHCQDEALILEYWKEKSGQREIGNVANEALSRGGKL